MIVFSKSLRWIVLCFCCWVLHSQVSYGQVSSADDPDSLEVPTDPTQLVSFLSKRGVLTQRDEAFIFRGVRVVFRKRNKWKVKRNRCVRVSEGKVAKMRHRWLWMPRRGAIRVRDVKRRYLAPGLFDMHIHYDCDNYTRLALLRYGVTSVRNFDYYSLQAREKDLVNSRNLVSPNVYHGFPHKYNSTGELYLPEDGGASFLVHKFSSRSEEELSRKETLADSLEVALEAWHGDEIGPIIEKSLVRTVEGMNVCTSPDWPNGEPDLELIGLLKGQDEIWEVPCGASSSGPWNLGRFIMTYYKNFHGEVPFSIIDDWSEIALGSGKDNRILSENMQAYHSDRIWILARMIKEGVPLLVGSESGSGMPLVYPGFSVHEEMQLFQDLGMEVGDVLDAATGAAARCLGVDRGAGRIAKGFHADMVLLTENPLLDIQNYKGIESVMVNGFWLGPEEMDWIKASLGETMPFTGRKLK